MKKMLKKLWTWFVNLFKSKEVLEAMKKVEQAEMKKRDYEMMQENMKLFGLKDFYITAYVTEWGARRNPHLPERKILLDENVLLSLLCFYGKDYMEKINYNPSDFDWGHSQKIKIFVDGKQIGHIAGPGHFIYLDAPDLETCITWLSITSMGRKRIVNKKDIVALAEGLPELAKAALAFESEAELYKYYERYWRRRIDYYLEYKAIVLTVGAHCDAWKYLWMVGTRLAGRQLEEPKSI